MESILIGLIPALLWGSLPIMIHKFGGKPNNQMMGMVTGTLLLAIIIVLIHPPVVWSANLIIASFLCGFAWSIAQFGLISTFPLIGVASAMPISTGVQLVGTALVGIFYFHEWQTFFQITLGLSAIAIIIVGITLATYQEKHAAYDPKKMRKGLLILVSTGMFFVIWVAIPRIANLDGWDVVFPQAIGAFCSSLFICLIKKSVNIWDISSVKNILTGLLFFGGNLIMMLSSQINGIAVGFTLTQMNVIVSGLGGLWILKEQKTTRELTAILGGLILVALGGVLIGLTKL